MNSGVSNWTLTIRSNSAHNCLASDILTLHMCSLLRPYKEIPDKLRISVIGIRPFSFEWSKFDAPALPGLSKCFKKSFPFQFINNALINELLQVDIAFYVGIALTDHLKGIANPFTNQARRKRKHRSIILVSRFKHRGILLFQPARVYSQRFFLVVLELVNGFAIGADKALYSIAVLLQV